MKLPCPNCRGTCQVDIPKTSWESLYVTCQQCSINFVIEGEFQAGADYRGTRTYCSRCGNTQPFSDHCTSCNGRFESFLIVRPENRANKDRPPTAGNDSTHTWNPISRKAADWFAARKRWLGLASLAVLALMVGLVFHLADSEEAYLADYVQAVYGIQSGFELSKNICLRYSAEGKNGTESGALQHIAPGKEKESLIIVKHEVDSLMSRLAKHPGAYEASFQKIRQLYATYEGQNALVTSSLDSGSCKMHDIQAFRNEYGSRLKDLKTGLPANLAEQFVMYGKTHDLRFFNEI